MYLTRIDARDAKTYTVTLAGDGDLEKDYDFTFSEGEISALEASPEFSEDVGAFGYSHLIYKAVSAFHQARQHPLGRPDEGR